MGIGIGKIHTIGRAVNKDKIKDSDKLKILIVAPYYPPSSMPPSQRVRMMVNYLHKFDIEPIVLTTGDEYREDRSDIGIVNLTRKDIHVIKMKAIPIKIARKIGFGDLGLRMLPFLIGNVRKTCRNNSIHHVIYLVPPWYILMVAPYLKYRTKIPFGIDFIDPWVKTESNKKGLKEFISQFIAKKIEGYVVRSADFIYSVSEPINRDLLKRHPNIKAHLKAIPYGVDLNDFKSRKLQLKNSTFVFRYIGAMWPKAIPVVDALLGAMKLLSASWPFQVEFLGTSYAGIEMSKNQLEDIITNNQVGDFVKEVSHRLPYSEVLELYQRSDALFIFGDMGDQYAASKLMPIIASGRPFFAFLNYDSYPFKILSSMKYKYLVGYSNKKGELPKDKITELCEVMRDLMGNAPNFEPLSFSNEVIKDKTAEGMTQLIAEGIYKTKK